MEPTPAPSPTLTPSVMPPVIPPDGQIVSAISQGEPKKSSPLKIIIPIVVVVALAVAAFFVVNFLNTPARVKEKTLVTQPVFDNFKRTIGKLSDHLRKESKADPDAIDRDAQEGDNLIKDAKKDKEQLTTDIASLGLSELSSYKNNLNLYLTKVSDLIDLEEQNVKLLRALSQPIRDYKKMTIDMSGASLYLYSDPAKYMSILDSAIKEEERIIGNLKQLDLKGDVKDLNDAFVKIMQVENDFLKEMKTAVDNRNNTQIATAQQKFLEGQQSAQQDYNRVLDKLDKKVRDTTDEADALSDKVNADYQGLRSKYNF